MRRNTNTAVQDPEATVCDACQLVPLTILALDIDVPVVGWPAFFRARGVEVVEDDLGRPSVRREVLGDLLTEREEHEGRMAAQRAEQAARRDPVPAGVPALEGATAFESLAASDGFTTASEEFRGGRTSVHQELLDERLNEGRRQAADAEAEAEAVDSARKLLDGRGK